MSENKSGSGGSGDQGGGGSGAGASGALSHGRLQPGTLISQGPRNPGTGSLSHDKATLTVEFKRPLQAEEYQAEEFGVTVKDTLSWQSAWLRAVSLAWSDDRHREALCENPYAFIHNYCGYAIPKTVNLVVLPDPCASYDQGEDVTNSWQWSLTRNVLVMFLPPKPKDAGADAVVAFASYQAVGCAYPFTATC